MKLQLIITGLKTKAPLLLGQLLMADFLLLTEAQAQAHRDSKENKHHLSTDSEHCSVHIPAWLLFLQGAALLHSMSAVLAASNAMT